MPTVLRVDGYRFFFYSNEGNEPPHIHVQKAEKYAKIWLHPIELADVVGFSSKEVNRIEAIVIEHRTQLLEAWHEHLAR